MRKVGIAQLLPASLALGLVACGSNPPAAERVRPPLSVTISAADELNPDLAGRPSPVAVLLLQLKSTEKFLMADYFAIYDPASEALAGDLVAREQVVLQPGEQRVISLQLAPDARFLGVTAAFRDIEQATWLTVAPLGEGPKGKEPWTASVQVSASAVAASIN